MTLRLLAIACVLAGLGVFTGYLHIVGKGPLSSPEARHLRAMKDRTGAPAAVEPVTFADMEALPDRLPLADYAAIERRGVSLEGYVQRMNYATDGDTHLEFTPFARPDRPDTDYVSCEVTPQSRRGRPAWNYEALAAELHPVFRDGVRWDRAPARVRLTGRLMFDNPHAENDAVPAALRYLWKRYGLGLALSFGEPLELWNRMTWWEIHPVTKIEVWDDSRGAWRELGGAVTGGAAAPDAPAGVEAAS